MSDREWIVDTMPEPAPKLVPEPAPEPMPKRMNMKVWLIIIGIICLMVVLNHIPVGPTPPTVQEYIQGIPAACDRVSRTFSEQEECVRRETEAAIAIFGR